eukprot:UN10965
MIYHIKNVKEGQFFVVVKASKISKSRKFFRFKISTKNGLYFIQVYTMQLILGIHKVFMYVSIWWCIYFVYIVLSLVS